MKTVLVTGAGGYIGRRVIGALKKKNVNIIAVDFRPFEAPDGVRKIYTNIFDEQALVFDEQGLPDVCLHLAWRDGFRHNEDSHIEDISSHFKFLKRLVDMGVTQIAVMGTMHEVGYWEGSIDEDTPCNPLNKYGIAKDALRRSLFALAKDSSIDIQWLRGFYIFGDDEKSQSIFGKLIKAADEGNVDFPFTSGKSLYDFIEVGRLADQISACILQDKVTGIINCCTGMPVSLAEQVESFIERNRLDLNLIYGAYPDREYDSPGVWGNPSKINGILAMGQIKEESC